MRKLTVQDCTCRVTYSQSRMLEPGEWCVQAERHTSPADLAEQIAGMPLVLLKGDNKKIKLLLDIKRGYYFVTKSILIF